MFRTAISNIKLLLESKRGELFFSEELLNEFADFLVPQIRKFYQSEEGKKFYEEWKKSVEKEKEENKENN